MTFPSCVVVVASNRTKSIKLYVLKPKEKNMFAQKNTSLHFFLSSLCVFDVMESTQRHTYMAAGKVKHIRELYGEKEMSNFICFRSFRKLLKLSSQLNCVCVCSLVSSIWDLWHANNLQIKHQWWRQQRRRRREQIFQVAIKFPQNGLTKRFVWQTLGHRLH
jgi:hypothetical protein